MSEPAEAPPRLAPGCALPAYAYRPGRTPHPERAAAGHGGIDPGCDSPGEGDPARTRFLYGFDLFNRGYYWEAHEAWEGLWHSHGRESREGRLLKGLIALAAAGLKLAQANPTGGRHHARRAETIFAALARQAGVVMGCDPARLAQRAADIAAEPPDAPAEDAPARRPEPVFAPLLPGESDRG